MVICKFVYVYSVLLRLLLCLLLRLFVIIYLLLEVVLHTTNSSGTHCHFCWYEPKSFRTPLGSTFAFARPRLTYTISLADITGTGVIPPRQSPICTKYIPSTSFNLPSDNVQRLYQSYIPSTYTYAKRVTRIQSPRTWKLLSIIPEHLTKLCQ